MTSGGEEPDREPTREQEDGSNPSLGDLADQVSGRTSTSSVTDADLNLGDSDEDDDSQAGTFEWSSFEEDLNSPSETVMDAIEDASNVLVLGPLTGSNSGRHCVNLLDGTDSEPRNVLFVSLTQTVTERWNTWREHATSQPPNLCVLSVGERTRGASSSSVTTTRTGPTTIRTETVSDASDLTRLGISMNKVLKEWEPNPYRTRVCLHSLTELLQYAEPQRLFRFIHILQGRLDSLDAVAHYHLYPEAHDDQTVAVFKTLFDTVVRVTADGELELVSPDSG